MSQHVMVDLETMGTAPGSVIASIGAATFNLYTGEILSTFYATIDQKSCLTVGLTVDPQTVQWWSQQSQEAQDALLKDTAPLETVLDDFRLWWIAQRSRYFWCQGANFDEPLLSAAFRAARIQVPWKFWDVRDTRTFYDAAGGVEVKREKGVYHNALYDALNQVDAVHRAALVLFPQHAKPKAAPVEDLVG